MIILLILGFLLIILIEVPGMLVQQQRGELLAFWVLLTAGFLLSLAVTLQWPVPSPTPALIHLITPLTKALGFH